MGRRWETSDGIPLPFSKRCFSGYLIFVRSEGSLSADQLLDQFGLAAYRPTRRGKHLHASVLVSTGDSWDMIADDPSYQLWHRSDARQRLEALAAQHDVYACSVGDCDRSYSIAYWSGNELRRNLVIDSPSFNDREVKTDFGSPLVGEYDYASSADEYSKVLRPAVRLGIDLRSVRDRCVPYTRLAASIGRSRVLRWLTRFWPR